MTTTLVIRPLTATDLPAIGVLIGGLGYTARRDGLLAMLSPMLEDRRNILLKGLADDLGMVAFMSLSSRPVLRLQGWVGTIEELVVRPEARYRGFGERMLQYAKGLASERGWVRLESVVARERESHRRGFLLARGFIQADRATYRWGLLEGRHPASPALDRETRAGELV
jgi:GNAT superfamily N-acetyltransferase